MAAAARRLVGKSPRHHHVIITSSSRHHHHRSIGTFTLAVASRQRLVGANVVTAVAVGGVGLGVTAATVWAPPARAEGMGGCDSTTMVAAAVLVGAAAAGYAAKMQSSAAADVDPDFRYMVDCGSGGTRVEKFGFSAQDGVYQEVRKSLQAQPLHKALIEGEEQQKRWLATLAQTLADNTTPIVIGATAGVRDCVASGVISNAVLKRFEQLVLVQFGARACFALVGGELEAASELAAVRYCVSEQEWWNRSIDSVAVMSSGGMSAQLTFPSDTGLVAASIAHNQKEANANIRDPEVGVDLGLSAFETTIQSLIAMEPALKKAKPASAAGVTFVGIEMVAQVADAAGIGGQLMSAGDAKSAVEKLVTNFKAKAAAASAEELANWTWKDVRWGTFGTLVLQLLSLLSPESSVYFCGKFDVPSNADRPGSSSGSRSLKPAWTLGWYINSRLAIGL